MRLKNKVAIVTGAGAGMGGAVAVAYAREGAKVVVVDVDEKLAQATVAKIQSVGGEASFIYTDVSEASRVKAMVASAVERYGGVDVLYNNAGVQFMKADSRAHELSEEIWDRTHAVNLKGAWLCAKYVIPAMMERGGGSIILVASPTGFRGCAPGATAYSSSKGGIIGLTRIMAVDYAKDHIRVNALFPATTETPMIAEALTGAEKRKRLAAAIPMGRIGQPEDVVGLAIFLAADEAAFCTGGFYMADGGMTAW
ncbi:MAG: glucose 1-dehydrogenase [Chloroflexi bacterium]|nr:glucose 1-dehydrogenase [Chloroflexota bacterium]